MPEAKDFEYDDLVKRAEFYQNAGYIFDIKARSWKVKYRGFPATIQNMIRMHNKREIPFSLESPTVIIVAFTEHFEDAGGSSTSDRKSLQHKNFVDALVFCESHLLYRQVEYNDHKLGLNKG